MLSVYWIFATITFQKLEDLANHKLAEKQAILHEAKEKLREVKERLEELHRRGWPIKKNFGRRLN